MFSRTPCYWENSAKAKTMRKSPRDNIKINNNIKLFGEDARKCPRRKMARKIILQNLKPQAKLKYIKKGGKELHKEEEI